MNRREPGPGHDAAEANAEFEPPQLSAHALRRAHSWIQGVAWMYRLGALAYAVATLYAVLALARTDVPAVGGTQVVWLTTTLCVVMLMAAMHILFRPFLWTIAVAVLASLITVVHYMGPNPYGLAFLASAAWAGVAWGALLPTYRFRCWIAEHKDQYVLYHSSLQTRRSLKGRTPEARHERLMKALARASRRVWRTSTLTAAGIILLSTLGAHQVLANLRPAPLTEAVQSFETAWNANDLEALESLFSAKVRAVESSKLRSVASGHGWTQTLPTLEPANREERGPTATLEYGLEQGALSADWALEDKRWVLARLELPYPSLDPTLELFVEGWTLSSPEDLAAFFSEEKRSEMQANLQNAKLKRGWIAFPEVKRVDAGEVDPRETTAVILVDGGEVTTQWHFRQDGTWGLHGLRLPTHRIRAADRRPADRIQAAHSLPKGD